MSRHEQSVAAPALASTVLPSAEVIHLPTARPKHARGRRIYEGQHQQNALPVGEIRGVVLGYEFAEALAYAR